MIRTFAAVRTAVYASGFVFLWAWVSQQFRRFDGALGGSLPAASRLAGIVVMAMGGLIAALCLLSFVIWGRGTPAPFDAPRRLVASGPYRYVRNPMYIGGGLLLLGFGLYLRSPAMALFAPIWWLMIDPLVVFYEERALRAKFGQEYEAYCRRTPRWIPSFSER